MSRATRPGVLDRSICEVEGGRLRADSEARPARRGRRVPSGCGESRSHQPAQQGRLGPGARPKTDHGSGRAAAA